MDELRGLEASMPAISRKKADSPIKRLEGCARTLGLEPTKSSFGIRPSHLERSVPLHGDVLLLVLDQLLSDSDKVALASVSRGVLTEQRALRPSTTQRVRISLDTLVSARAAGWCVSHCHVDKRSGSWVTSGQSDDALADLRTLSVVGRPDCALLVLSPLTDLHAMRQLHTFELDSCAIGDAGVAVLAAAFRNGALQTLQVLDLRRNQVSDGGAQALATAFVHTSSTGALLPRLHTLGLDSNKIGDPGLTALAAALKLGAVNQLSSLFVDDRCHPELCAVCADRRIELACW